MNSWSNFAPGHELRNDDSKSTGSWACSCGWKGSNAFEHQLAVKNSGSKKTYEQNVFCKNCKVVQTLFIPLGKTVSEYLWGSSYTQHKCGNCGCDILGINT